MPPARGSESVSANPMTPQLFLWAPFLSPKLSEGELLN